MAAGHLFVLILLLPILFLQNVILSEVRLAERSRRTPRPVTQETTVDAFSTGLSGPVPAAERVDVAVTLPGVRL
jgi:hypothetical protein